MCLKCGQYGIHCLHFGYGSLTHKELTVRRKRRRRLHEKFIDNRNRSTERERELCR